MDVPDLDITWSHTYSGGEKIAVPGFSVSVGGVYVQIDLTNNGDTLSVGVAVVLMA